MVRPLGRPEGRKVMRWKKCAVWIALFAVLFALLCMPFPCYAQDYSFSMDQEVVDVWVNQDGSVRLEYWFTFTCALSGHPIDVVDLGLPTGDYSISDLSGDVDGIPIDRVDSDYQGGGAHGVAVWLGSGTINPGDSGTVHVVVDRVGRMVYEDSEDPEYASTEFSPTYFGSEFVRGSTDMKVRFHLPPGVQAEEPRWHSSPVGWPSDRPGTALDQEGRVLYTWHHSEAEPDRQYLFGASFPRQYVDEAAIQKGPSALEELFAAITGALSCCCNPVFLVFAVGAGIMGLSVWGNRRRKMQYLPPSMKVEGVGIKRGLTAVEAAIVLETPLDKVLTMMLFGLLKKGAVTVLDDKPLKIQVNEPQPDDLHPYEVKFLAAVNKDSTLSEAKLRSTMTGLVKAVNNKMKGFSRKETVAYYRDIVRRAWEQVEGAETPQVRSERFDEGLEWTMLDDDFDDRTERVFRTGPVYVPYWWGFYRPWATATASAGRAAPATGTRTGGAPSARAPSLPTLPGAAFAASVVRGVQGTASNIVSNVTSFTGGVTKVTNPPPKPSSSGRSYRGGGGGSSCACACACACAGCACACAGGGR